MAGLNIGKAKKVLGSTFVENHDKINEDEAAHLIVRAEQKIKEKFPELPTGIPEVGEKTSTGTT
jgi:hypothetical protein